MNRKYLITYDLKTQNWNYTGFFTALQNIGTWWHFLTSTWIIKGTTLTPQEIYNRLAPHISTTDSILIVEINAEHKAGYLPQAAWAWLNN